MSSFLKIPGSRFMAAALLLAILTIIVPAAPASAVPPAPHQFYGNVFVGGVAPTTGTVIAKINGIQYATGTIDSLGRYGYSTPLFRVPADNPDTADKEGGVLGDTVQFFVGGTQAYQTCLFQSGSSTNLDLTVPGSITSPAVSTVAAGNIASTTVTLNGNLTVTGSQVPLNIYFRYGTTTGYGMATAPVSTSSTGQFAAYVSGLTPNTLYNFVAVAEGSSTVQATNNLTFTTLASSVTVATIAATNVGTNAATLNGNLTSLGGTGGVEVYFQYGTNGTTWPYTTPRQGMSAIGTFSYPINALSSNTKYYFQAVAVFGGNSVTGSILNFTTLPQGGSTAVNRFYGTVYVGGSPTSSANVVAYLNGVATTPASTTSSTTLGQYGYSPLFNVYGGPGTVTFKVNNVLVPQTAVWTSGGVTQLDLYSPAPAGPTIAYSPTSLSFVSTGGATPDSQTLEIWNSGTGTISYTCSKTASWLTISPTSGTSTGAHNTHTVSVNVTGLADGTYNDTITIAASGAVNTPQTISVTLTKGTLTVPYISRSPTSFAFSAPLGGPNPANQTLDIWNSGVGTLNWTAAKTQTWLSISPTSGSSTGAHNSVTLSADVTGLSTGTYNDTITISATGAGNTPQTVAVTLTVGIGPTRCGTDPIGCTVGAFWTSVLPNYVYACRYVAGSTTNISKINVNCTGSGNIKVAIYTDAGATVGTLIAGSTGSAAVISGTQSIPLASSVSITSGTAYWLVEWSDAQIFSFTNESGIYAYRAISAPAPFTFPSSLDYMMYPTPGLYRGLISGSN
jgi:hypothetical protein